MHRSSRRLRSAIPGVFRQPLLFLLVAVAPPAAADPQPAAILKDMRRVADWQLANPSKHPLHDWTQAPFFMGLESLHQVSGDARYLDMMFALQKLQHADGLWRTSLLDPEGPQGESSGSAFFVYAMAWGVNRGLLPAATFRPQIIKGYQALADRFMPAIPRAFARFLPERKDDFAWDKVHTLDVPVP